MYLLNKKNILLCGMLLASALQGVSATSNDESWVCWLVDSTLNYGPAVAGGTAGATAFYAINRAYHEYLFREELGKISSEFVELTQHQKERIAQQKVDKYLAEMSDLGWTVRHGLIFLGSAAVGVLVWKSGSSFVESTIEKRKIIKENNAMILFQTEYPGASEKQKKLILDFYKDALKKGDVQFKDITIKSVGDDYAALSDEAKIQATAIAMGKKATSCRGVLEGYVQGRQAVLGKYYTEIDALGNFSEESKDIKGLSWLNTVGLKIQGGDVNTNRLKNAESTSVIKEQILNLKGSCKTLIAADQKALNDIMGFDNACIKTTFEAKISTEKPSFLQQAAIGASPALLLESIKTIPTVVRYVFGRKSATNDAKENASDLLFTIYVQLLPQISADMAKIVGLDYDNASESLKKNIEHKLNQMHASLVQIEIKLMGIPEDDSENYEEAMECKKAILKLRGRVIDYVDEHAISLIGVQAQGSGN